MARALLQKSPTKIDSPQVVAAPYVCIHIQYVCVRMNGKGSLAKEPYKDG